MKISAIHLWRPQKITFLTPPVHMRPHGPDPSPPPYGRPHTVDMKYSPLKWLVQWPTGPKAEIRLYDSNLFKLYFKKFISLIYIAEKFASFLSKDKILVKKTPISLHEKKTVCRQWTLILIFCVDVHVEMGLDPLPPSTCVHLSLTPSSPPPCGRHKWMAPIVVITNCLTKWGVNLKKSQNATRLVVIIILILANTHNYRLTTEELKNSDLHKKLN